MDEVGPTCLLKSSCFSSYFYPLVPMFFLRMYAQDFEIRRNQVEASLADYSNTVDQPSFSRRFILEVRHSYKIWPFPPPGWPKLGLIPYFMRLAQPLVILTPRMNHCMHQSDVMPQRPTLSILILTFDHFCRPPLDTHLLVRSWVQCLVLKSWAQLHGIIFAEGAQVTVEASHTSFIQYHEMGHRPRSFLFVQLVKSETSVEWSRMTCTELVVFFSTAFAHIRSQTCS